MPARPQVGGCRIAARTTVIVSSMTDAPSLHSFEAVAISRRHLREPAKLPLDTPEPPQRFPPFRSPLGVPTVPLRIGLP